MQLIIDTLEAARLNASPSVAMDLADAIADLRALDAAAKTCDLQAVADAVQSFDALRDHMAASPFADTTWDDLLAPAVVEWLAVLERIAS